MAAGCSWCGRDDVILGGVVACWAADRQLAVCQTCAGLGLDALDDRLCRVCGKPLVLGQQGCIVTIRPHDPVLTYHPFTPYFDVGLGEEITSLAQRWRLMRKQEDGEGLVVRERLDYRDHPSKGELSARRDRNEHLRQERARGHRP